MSRILVAEDDIDIRDALAALFGDEGYEVVAAENGLEALEKLRLKRVDLVVTDVNMPFMDGEQMLSEAHKDASLRQIPVIVMSAGAREDVAHRFHCAYLRKPVEFYELLHLAQGLIRA
jgi:CheY-like chemotaxis protein